MAMAWITRAVNSTDQTFTLLQDDPTWHPVINGKQYGKDEPIEIKRMTRQGEPIPLPWPFPPGTTYPAPSDMVTDFSLRYCVVPWQGFGRLRLVGPTGNYIEYQVGRFVTADKDHLRGVLSNGDTPLLVELGDTGGAWWSTSYDFEIYIQQDQGVRWLIQSVSQSPLPSVVAAAGDALKEYGPKLLAFLLA